MDTKSKPVDGVTFTCTHSGQKRAYGDTFREYTVESDLPPDEVERICRESINKAIPEANYKRDLLDNYSMANAFRPYYRFTAKGGGKFFYQVIETYTD